MMKILDDDFSIRERVMRMVTAACGSDRHCRQPRKRKWRKLRSWSSGRIEAWPGANSETDAIRIKQTPAERRSSAATQAFF